MHVWALSIDCACMRAFEITDSTKMIGKAYQFGERHGGLF